MIPLASIAFDIDGVVANTMGLFIDIARDKHNISIQYDQINTYDLTQCLDIEFDVIWDILQQIMNGNHDQPLMPIEQAAEILKTLGNISNNLLFVTARPDANALIPWFLETLQLSEQCFKIVATGDFQQKISVLQEHHVKYFVEDRMETCRLLNDNGIKPIVFCQPWNREAHSFIEVKTWNDLYKLIDTNKRESSL
jgi:hypothetical protein